jgi:hypothetical protein
MRHNKDLTGLKFGRLKVLHFEKVEKGKKKNKYFWKCFCDCGREVLKTSRGLLSGETKSCGCLHLETASMLGEKYGRLKKPWFGHKRGWTHKQETKDKLSKKLSGIPKTEEQRKRKCEHLLLHERYVTEEIEKFRKQGFRCIRVDKKPIPDFIAIRDGKPFAVEIQFKFPNYNKYKDNNPQLEYADIFWVTKK